MSKSSFKTEADLCAAFLSRIGDEWTVYPETGGFDILLSRKDDGTQIGIEAKLALNAKVVSQILPAYRFEKEGPEYRAVLVPEGTGHDLRPVCDYLGITVIRVGTRKFWHRMEEREGVMFNPALPKSSFHDWEYEKWHEWMPLSRVLLPDYVPDVAAGKSSPVSLTPWKIKAIKLAILLETRPVTRADFLALKLSASRWTDPGARWLERTPVGYVPGRGMPDFRAQHPTNYEQIKADAAEWMADAKLIGAAA